MGSEALEVEKKTPEAHGSPSELDREQQQEAEQVTPEEQKRGTKRESPEKQQEEPEEEGSKTKRPSRERKTVERYSAVSPRKLSASKALKIVEGSGTKLKDIPNVVFKLSKRKVDENLQALHTILFGRKSNAHFLKRNILQFSGFVWTENKEKCKAKVKEKLDKYTKEKLIDFCDLLDIHFPKTTTKKEDVSAKLLEFLESPHVTRDLLLADQEKKGKKRRSRTKISLEAAEDASLDKETKKHKKSAQTEVKKGRKQSPKAAEEHEHEDEDSGGSDGGKDASSGEEDNNGLEQESDHDKVEEEDEENESEEPRVRKKGSDVTEPEDAAEPEDKVKNSPIKKASSAKSDKSPSRPISKKAAQPVEDEPDVAVDNKNVSTKEQTRKSSKATTKEKATPVRKEDKKKSSRKSASADASDSGPSKSSKSKKDDKKEGQNKEKEVREDKKARKKKEDKPLPKVSTKEQGKGKKNAGPSTEELHSVVTNILKEVDFNTATLADILKQLGAHFNMDLMDRKAEVKSIIEDVINNMTDDDEDEDGDNLGDNQEDENTKEEESGDGKE